MKHAILRHYRQLTMSFLLATDAVSVLRDLK